MHLSKVSLTILFLGDENRFPISHKALNMTALLGIYLTLAASTANHLLGFPIETVLFSLISLVYFIVIYFIYIK